MYAGRDVGVSDGTVRVYGFDVGPQLRPGERILSVTSSLTISIGSDAVLDRDSRARFRGDPYIQGNAVAQCVSLVGGSTSLVGNIYIFTISAVTSLDQTIGCWTKLRMDLGYGNTLLPVGRVGTIAIYLVAMPMSKFLLPASGGYCGEDFPIADIGESRLYGFDLSPSLAPTEAIDSVEVGLSVFRGSDDRVGLDPLTYCPRLPEISGSTVWVPITWPSAPTDISNNTYVLSLSALTTFNQSLGNWSRIAISTKS